MRVHDYLVVWLHTLTYGARTTPLLQAYALISTGVRMAVYNQPKSRARSTVLTTQGSAEVRQNVSTVFGAKFLGTLEAYEVDLDADLDGDEDGPSASNDVDVNDGESKHQTAVGFVSKAGTSCVHVLHSMVFANYIGCSRHGHCAQQQ